MPEAVAAVVKDRSKNVDRFEREMSQDGFIQRNIDDTMIRFRVSIMPIVGVEIRHKFESIVIRVLDDRKVITDLKKLGLMGPSQGFLQPSHRETSGHHYPDGSDGFREKHDARCRTAPGH